MFYLVLQMSNEHIWIGAVKVSDILLCHLTDVAWAKRRHRKVFWHCEVSGITSDDTGPEVLMGPFMEEPGFDFNGQSWGDGQSWWV